MLYTNNQYTAKKKRNHLYCRFETLFCISHILQIYGVFIYPQPSVSDKGNLLEMRA